MLNCLIKFLSVIFLTLQRGNLLSALEHTETRGSGESLHRLQSVSRSSSGPHAGLFASGSIHVFKTCVQSLNI